MKRRLIRYTLLAAGGAVILASVLAFILLRNPGTLQDWIGSQLQEIANGYLNPKLSFTDLNYQYPLTVSLKNLHLTSDDPANPGHTIDIIACQSAEVSLADIPSIGKPIVIQKIALSQPLISAVAVEPGSKKFIGFADLVRASAPSTDSNAPPKPRQKLSDVFRMRRVQIIDGKIVYNPRIPGTVPMQLDQINTVLDIEPTDAGWYMLNTKISRDPVFDLHVSGQLSLDSLAVKGADITLLADLSRDKLDFLPPELQSLLKQYEASGKLKVHVMGSLPLQDPLSGKADVNINLERANVALRGLRIPVDGLELDASYQDNKVTLGKLDIDALGGSAGLSGSLLLNDRLDAVLRLSIIGMVPEKLFADPARISPYPARLDLDLNVATSLLSMFGKAAPLPGVPLATISLKNLDVSTKDPANPADRVDVIACRNLQVRVTEPILPGHPIVIDSILLQQPIFSAVSITPGSMQFVGIPNLPAASTSNTSSTGPAPTTESTKKPSDLFRIKSFTLSGAKIVYDPRIPGTQRMCLDPINTTINIDPDNPGAYKIDAQIAREPAFNLGIRGEIDIDNPALQNINLDLRADLTGNQLDFLPPQLQLVLRRTRTRAKLNFHGGGSVALSDLSRATAKIDTDIQNFYITQGDLQIPIKDLSIDAQLRDGKVFPDIHIAALNNNFNITGSVTLNKYRDIDLSLLLKDIKIEPLLAALNPNKPQLPTSTTLNAQVELKSPLMVALGAFAGTPGEPVATLDIRDLRLTTVDPRNPPQPLDFFACRDLGASISKLPVEGNLIEIDRIDIDHPALRAIATAPQSKDFAGFVALQNIAASEAPPATAPSQNSATTSPSEPPEKLSHLFRVKKLAVVDASLYYDPRIESESDPTHPTVPLSLNQIALNANTDSSSGDAYHFNAVIPSKQNFYLTLDGRINVDTLNVKLNELALTTNLGTENPAYLPPQVQALLPPYKLTGLLDLKVSGDVPLLNPMAANLNANLKLDDFRGTFGSFRFPVAHLRLPLHLTRQQIDFLDPTALGGPTAEAFGGSLTLTGSLLFNDRLDSTLALHIDRMTLQDFMACKTPPSKTELIGTVQADIQLNSAPLILIANDAGNVPPALPPGSPPPPEPPVADATTPPTYASNLPDNWGNATIAVTHARLAGLELIQGMGNIAKSVFADLFKHEDKNKPQTIIPKENAHLVFTLDKDRLDFSQIHYEGEAIAADGKGYITLEQQLDLVLTGGLIQKLGGLGAVGNWIKEASDSLLYYHIYGTFHDINYTVKRGDGKPIVSAVKTGAKAGEKYLGIGINKAGEGLNQAGKFFDGLFNKHKKKDDAQTQPSDQ